MLRGEFLTLFATEEGGDNEIFGNVTTTFTRPDGTQLGKDCMS